MEKITITNKDLSLVEENLLNAKQLKILLQKTPQKYIHKRPGKGGGQWEYVTGGYVRKVLNLMFGWNWSFEILSEQVLHGEVIVKGKLTCTLPNGQQIIKTQFGNKEVIAKGNGKVLSIGNDFKAAATDALKKCAAELGVASDIYNKLDFQAVNVVDDKDEDKREEIMELIMQLQDVAPSEILSRCSAIVQNRENKSYDKAIKILTEYVNSK